MSERLKLTDQAVVSIVIRPKGSLAMLVAVLRVGVEVACVAMMVTVIVSARRTAVVRPTTMGNGMQRIAGEGNACVEHKRGESES